MKASSGLVAAAEERRKREAQDELVLDIAKGENESVTLSVRAAIERGYQATFIDSLREALKKKENEIDRICGRNYSEFLTSTADMLRMRGAASDLTDIVRKIHGDFNNSGEEMVAVLTRLEELQTERSQTRAVLETVISCKELSKLMLQAKNFLDAGEHYSAMQIVEKVQKGYLPLPGVVTPYGGNEVVQHELPKPVRAIIDRWMPRTIFQLTSITTDAADVLLFRLRDKAQLIGRVVLKRQGAVALIANKFSLGDDTNSATAAAPSVGGASDYSAILSDLYADRYAQLTLLHKAPTFSLQHVKRCASSLRLQRWLEPGDVSGWISHRYQWGKISSKTRSSKKDKNGAGPAGASLPSTSSPPDKDKKSSDYLHKVTDQEERFLDELSENLGPLHKAIHIAAVLHQQPHLHEHLRGQRGPALTDILDANEQIMRTCSLTDPGGLTNYISSIAGFFMLECVLRRSVERQEGAFAWPEIIELWTTTCIRLDILVARQTDSLRTPEQILMVKDEISLLAEICNDEALGLPTSPLYETIRLLWSRFEELQIGAIHEAVVVASISHKAYEGLYVMDMKTLATKVLAFSLENVQFEETKTGSEIEFAEKQEATSPGLGNEKNANTKAKRRATNLLRNLDNLEDEIEYMGDSQSPRNSESGPASPALSSGGSGKFNTGAMSTQSDIPTLPHTYLFSFLVPETQRALYLMVTRIVAFSAKNPLLGNMGEATCNSLLKAYECVAQTLNRELTLAGVDTPLGKAAQVSMDAATLAFASKHCYELLKQSLHTLHWNQRMDEPLASSERSARTMLLRLSLEAQDVVYEILRSKTMELLESLVFMDLTPKTLSLHPHEVIEDAIQFLEAKMGVLSSLPQAARTIAFFTCCNCITHAVLQHLMSDKVKVINVFFLAALEQDCRTLSKYALTTNIASLHMCFAELHETAQAAIHKDLPKLATDPVQRHRLFPKLDPFKLAQLLDKVQAVPSVPPSSMLPVYDASSAKAISANLRKKHKEETKPAGAPKVVLKTAPR